MGEFKIVKFDGPEALAKSAAARLLQFVAGRRETSICLSGGRITVALFHELVKAVRSEAPGTRELRGSQFFWADERCVPASDPESNFGIASREFFEPAEIDSTQIHRIPGDADPTFAARMAEAELCRIVPLTSDGTPIIDLLLLGMGEDGHVASLFPGQTVSSEWADAVYRPVSGPKPPPNRITLSFPAIQAAAEVWVLVSGAGKEESFRRACASDTGLPLGRVIKERSNTLILTDLKM